MARNLLSEPLNDGLLVFGRIETKRDVETRKKASVDFVEDGRLFFGYQTINPKFDSYVVSNLSVVSLKVKVYFVHSLLKSHKVKLGDSLYEIEQMDPDRKQEHLYLFLKKVGEWDGGNFKKVE